MTKLLEWKVLENGTGRAWDEGWCLDDQGRRVTIRARKRFRTDAEAQFYVWGKALDGSEFHRQALGLMAASLKEART